MKELRLILKLDWLEFWKNQLSALLANSAFECPTFVTAVPTWAQDSLKIIHATKIFFFPSPSRGRVIERARRKRRESCVIAPVFRGPISIDLQRVALGNRNVLSVDRASDAPFSTPKVDAGRLDTLSFFRSSPFLSVSPFPSSSFLHSALCPPKLADFGPFSWRNLTPKFFFLLNEVLERKVKRLWYIYV